MSSSLLLHDALLMWPEPNILFFNSLSLQFTNSTHMCFLFSLFTTSSRLCYALKCSLWLLSCISLKTTGIKSLTITKGEHFGWLDTIDWHISEAATRLTHTHTHTHTPKSVVTCSNPIRMSQEVIFHIPDFEIAAK